MTWKVNITLIGMPGVGKSFIGKKLASKLGYKFIDTDVLIEKKQGKELQKVLDELGEKKFLEIEESEVLELKGDKLVISPGGSIIYSRKGVEHLKEISKIIYLEDGLRSIKKRVRNSDSRGIVGLKKKSFEELFYEREKLYEKYADYVVEMENFNVEKIIDKIISFVFSG